MRYWRHSPHRPGHADAPGAVQFVTFRLADSLPSGVLPQESEARQTSGRRWRLIENRLDEGLGSCLLACPVAARAVADCLRHNDGRDYRLLAWCIMPNHVHAIAQTRRDISRIVRGWKGYTAKWIINNRAMIAGAPHAPPVWRSQYWDVAIGSEERYARAVEYVHWNPVKAGLVKAPEDWEWSSARLPLRYPTWE